MKAVYAAVIIMGVMVAWTVLKAGAIAAAVWFEVTFPKRATAAYVVYQEKRGRCFLVGLVNACLGVFLVILLLSIESIAVLGIALGSLLFIVAILSYGPGYKNLSDRINSGTEVLSPMRSIVQGGVLSELLFFVPVLGQLLSLGYLLRGLGSLSLVAFQGKWKIVAVEE